MATDVMMEDQHFHLSWSIGCKVGVRVTAQNLADINTMGRRPSALVASVVAPHDMDSNVFLNVVRGLGGHAHEVGVGMVGGDLSMRRELVISITVLGYCPSPVVRHDGARPGDVAAISGTLGYSYAGLDLLGGGYADPSSRGVEQLGKLAPFIEAYRMPRPPLGSGVAAATTGARAMMDLSSGPAMDAGRIAQASGVVVKFDQSTTETEANQLAPAAHICAIDPVRWVLQGEKEHGVIAVFPPDALLPDGFRVVGGVRTYRSNEEPQTIIDEAILHGTWDRFSADSVGQCDVGRWSLCWQMGK